MDADFLDTEASPGQPAGRGLKQTNSHVMRLLGRAAELEAQGHSIVHLEVGEPDFPTPEPIVEAGTPWPRGARATRRPADSRRCARTSPVITPGATACRSTRRASWSPPEPRAPCNWFIADEIYQGLTYEAPDRTALALGSEDLYVINSFSKYFGMTGWRLGWLVGPADAVSVMDRMAQNLFLAVNTPAQYAARPALAPATRPLLDGRALAFRQRRDQHRSFC